MASCIVFFAASAPKNSSTFTSFFCSPRHRVVSVGSYMTGDTSDLHERLHTSFFL